MFAVPLPTEEKPPFPSGVLNALEGLGVQKVGVVGTTLEAKDSPENFVIRFSKLVIVSRVEAPRHTPVQQSQLPPPSAGGPQAEPLGRHIV